MPPFSLSLNLALRNLGEVRLLLFLRLLYVKEGNKNWKEEIGSGKNVVISQKIWAGVVMHYTPAHISLRAYPSAGGEEVAMTPLVW